MQVRVVGNLGNWRDDHVAQERGLCAMSQPDFVASVQEVEGDTLRNNRISLVLRVARNKAPHPRGRCDKISSGAFLDEGQVLSDADHRGVITLDVIQVGVAQGQQTGERAFSVHDLRHGHLLALIALGPRGPGFRLVLIPWNNVLAEPEFTCIHGVDLVGPPHVLVHLRQRHQELQVEDEEHSRNKDNKRCERGVLEVGQLNLHGTELCAPTDVRAALRLRWRWLPAHRLPIR
mmetsp:Transcript_80836/g.262107  ORF Transcript_80836/g.262107 Transcript_80836/m.262107 type:complete len:233 (-) Transcript_80836:1316-2014(-)